MLRGCDADWIGGRLMALSCCSASKRRFWRGITGISMDGRSPDEPECLRWRDDAELGYGEYREWLCSRYVGEPDAALDGGILAMDGEWVGGCLHVVGG